MSKAVNSNFFFNSLLAGLVNMSKRKATSAADSSQAKKPKPKGHWSEGLLNAMKDPEKVVLSDDKVCVIKDGFPKAEVHYLVMPKDDIKSLKHVDKSHLELLKHMHSTAEKLTSDEGKRKFLIGYHAEPSMTRLHLHVLSDDMNSPCLKHKKHWNSYTTKFFLKSEGKISKNIFAFKEMTLVILN